MYGTRVFDASRTGRLNGPRDKHSWYTGDLTKTTCSKLLETAVKGIDEIFRLSAVHPLTGHGLSLIKTVISMVASGHHWPQASREKTGQLKQSNNLSFILNYFRRHIRRSNYFLTVGFWYILNLYLRFFFICVLFSLLHFYSFFSYFLQFVLLFIPFRIFLLSFCLFYLSLLLFCLLLCKIWAFIHGQSEGPTSPCSHALQQLCFVLTAAFCRPY